MKPIRIQRKRTKNWKMPLNTVYVGRPTAWGNSFVVGSSFVRKKMQPGGGEISGKTMSVEDASGALLTTALRFHPASPD